MSLWIIIIGIIVLAGVGIGVYFILKNKSKSSPPVSSNNPVLLQLTAGSIENQI
jgi:uncharacterized protein YneF (UPF0154 family)